MYEYISTIGYEQLKVLFYDYNDEEIKTLYDKYNGLTLLQKTMSEVKEFEIQEFLILQNQLRGIYNRDPQIFSDENIKQEVFHIIKKNAKEERQVC